MEQNAEIAEKLQHLLDCLGGPAMAERLGVDEQELFLILGGEVDINEEVAVRLAQLLEGFGLAMNRLPFGGDDKDGVELVAGGEVAEALAPIGMDLDGDGVTDLMVPNLGIVQGGKPTFSDETERRKQNLRAARVTALMTQFRDDMEHEELVSALGMVAQIELCLIMAFRESLPEPGQDWDGERRAREIDKRLARLRWVKRENDRMFGGVKGVYNWMRGRRPVSGRQLYERMVRETNLMLDIMENRVAGKNMDDVLRRAGLGYLVED